VLKFPDYLEEACEAGKEYVTELKKDIAGSVEEE
jgi:hypothetical protein